MRSSKISQNYDIQVPGEILYSFVVSPFLSRYQIRHIVEENKLYNNMTPGRLGELAFPCCFSSHHLCRCIKVEDGAVVNNDHNLHCSVPFIAILSLDDAAGGIQRFRWRVI
jgi:hypothetical protein